MGISDERVRELAISAYGNWEQPKGDGWYTDTLIDSIAKSIRAAVDEAKCNCNCHDPAAREAMDMEEHGGCDECADAIEEENDYMLNAMYRKGVIEGLERASKSMCHLCHQGYEVRYEEEDNPHWYHKSKADDDIDLDCDSWRIHDGIAELEKDREVGINGQT